MRYADPFVKNFHQVLSIWSTQVTAVHKKYALKYTTLCLILGCTVGVLTFNTS